MDELTNKSWVPVPSRSVRVGRPLEAGDGVSSKTRKEVRTKSVRTWFWICVLFIIVVVGLALWPVRKLYLTLKEKIDERWRGTVL